MLEFFLAQSDGSDAAAGAGGAIFALGCCTVYIAIIVGFIVGMWKCFEKAGKPGWAAIIPIYNIIVMLEIVGRPLWWIILFFIPVVSVIAFVIVSIDFAKSFGKDAAYGIGLFILPFVFYPLLGFGDAKYVGASAQP